MAGFLRSLFSRGANAEEPPRDKPSVEYNGYTITPIPVEISRDIEGGRPRATFEKNGVKGLLRQEERRIPNAGPLGPCGQD